MIGSLRKIWPWKEVLEYRINSSGEQVPLIEANIPPVLGSEFAFAIVLAIVGFALVMALDYWASSSQPSQAAE